MRYAITITGAPYTSQAPQTAFRFCEALLARGHEIHSLFLYGDGVYLASHLQTPPRDEVNWYRRWTELLSQANVPAIVCVASALRRGLVDEREARRHELEAFNVRAPWQIAGLGTWIEARTEADRALQFGPGN
ncbi:sulfurtransferase complex subunit TusD [Marinobacteraceae bacterium S3BR75-40.1]